MAKDTSGLHDPYYYESFVGLLEVVKLLNPDEDVASVLFQGSDTIKWDDVSAGLKDGGKRCYQIKHTRENASITFGDLVAKDDKGRTLIGDLFKGAVESGLLDSKNRLILFTNRKAGSERSKRKNGDARPKLLKFWKALKKQIDSDVPIGAVTVDVDDQPAWKEWLGCFPSGKEPEVAKFLKLLEIKTSEDELEGIESRIKSMLTDSLGSSAALTETLYKSLVTALRKWTTTGWHADDTSRTVVSESVCEALAIEPSELDYGTPPPPPTPYFESRVPFAKDLESELKKQAGLPVVFLSGDAGSGKTSCVSWLTTQRKDEFFDCAVNARFFCFEPIRPEKPFIDPDASKVTAVELWGSLLTQIRILLRGRLSECRVPVRNDLLKWSEMREHVLRLADFIGAERGAKFVIAIDGIDHAARAAQVNPDQVREFFRSIPSPDQLADKNVRLLIAGQPEQFYPDQYPNWLKLDHPNVDGRILPAIKVKDVEQLLHDCDLTIPVDQIETAARMIFELTKGSTLATVFSVAEASMASTVDELEASLKERRLSDTLTDYYQSIWTSALSDRPEVSCCLACAISLSRTHITAAELAIAFQSWDLPEAMWQACLIKLKPLLEQHADGYRIRHNDVRVFLAQKFQGSPPEQKRSVCEELANFYCSDPAANRISAHLQLPELLRLAGQPQRLADIFDTDWVLEGVSLDIPYKQLWDEAAAAAEQLSANGCWNNVVSVACGMQTLDRLTDDADHGPTRAPVSVPTILSTESLVRPTDHWTSKLVCSVVRDIGELCGGSELARAKGLIQRWFQGLNLKEILDLIPDSTTQSISLFASKEGELDESLKIAFRDLGACCAQLNIAIQCPHLKDLNKIERTALKSFEEGFCNEKTSDSNSNASLDDVFGINKPFFISNIESSIRNLASNEDWSLVCEWLETLSADLLTSEFLAETTWYALKSGVANKEKWLAPLSSLTMGLQDLNTNGMDNYSRGNIRAFTCVAGAIGWTRSDVDPIDIPSVILRQLGQIEKRFEAQVKTLLLAAGCVGRLERDALGDSAGQKTTISPVRIGEILRVLWGNSFWAGLFEHAAELAEQIVGVCKRLGGEYEAIAQEAAVAVAPNCPLGRRMKSIWNLVRNAGKPELLRNWMSHHIGDEGAAFKHSNSSVVETIDDLKPYALEIGLDELFNSASERTRWMLIDYRDRKEYAFQEVGLWFEFAIAQQPDIWTDQGWKLWQLCENCRLKYAHNSFSSSVYHATLGAAMNFGAAGWLSLIESTLDNVDDESWHQWARDWVVSGTIFSSTVESFEFADRQPEALWALAVGFSYWFSDTDNSDLLILGKSLISKLDCKPESELLKRIVQVQCSDSEASDQTIDRHSAVFNPAAADNRTDAELWSAVCDAVSKTAADQYRHSCHQDLFQIARGRAFARGVEVVLAGLEIQIQMHSRWSFGANPTWNARPDIENVTWEEGAARLFRLLLDSFSNEVVCAGLEGMHALVDQNPAAIRILFETLTDGRSERWLLNSAEVWATLHSEALNAVKPILEDKLSSEHFDIRLQAWLVLKKLSENLNEEFCEFPLPENPNIGEIELAGLTQRILSVPANIVGKIACTDRNRAALSVLKLIERFGLGLPDVEAIVSRELGKFEPRDSSTKPYGPKRYDGTFMSDFQTEIAVGNALCQTVSTGNLDQTQIPALALALLVNEDPWIYRTRPQQLCLSEAWESNPDDLDDKENEMFDRLVYGIPSDWSLLGGVALDFQYPSDSMLTCWLEAPANIFGLGLPEMLTSASGRSFVWWNDVVFESGEMQFASVSVSFSGGHHRLPHCSFAVQPAKHWSERLGWKQSSTNATVWEIDGEEVAKYQRLSTEGASRSDGHRQPVLQRWIVKTTALENATEVFGKLETKRTFDSQRSRDH
ncbi:hypothetical protein CA51_33750 [Rosistilla oblonga]|uniref:ATP-binding protein n=1 Tax=Rosistilla oblonga TaxID=2527990 RepID=UPI00118BE70B|nr:ATP-binding protein [Rosistilla oblonga]QDV13485.1 hypothetical protein CA51_33750 [Rosistilla oblonga]